MGGSQPGGDVSSALLYQIVGILVIGVGIVVFVFVRTEGTNKLKFLGLETEVSAPSLVIVVLGVLILLFPAMRSGRDEPAAIETKVASPTSSSPGKPGPEGPAERRGGPVSTFAGLPIDQAVRANAHDAMVKCALDELDRKAVEEPGRNNYGDRIETYYRRLNKTPDGADWAAAFASYCIIQTDAEGAVKPSADIDALLASAKATGIFVENNGANVPGAGDLIFIKRFEGEHADRPSHVAIVVNVDRASRKALYVGGNQSDKVGVDQVWFIEPRVLGWANML